MRCSTLLAGAAAGLTLVGWGGGGGPVAGAGTANFLKRPLGEWRADLQKGDRPDLRRSAAFALGQMGAAAEEGLGDLMDRVSADRDAGVREMAARAVGDVVRGVAALSKPARAWETAGKALEAALVRDADARVRRSAAYALGSFGELAARSLPALRRALRDPSPTVRQNAAWAVGKVGDAGDDTVRDLFGVLGDDSPLVRRLAAGALGELAGRHRTKLPEAARALVKMLRDERDDAACRTALGALAQMTDEGLQKYARDLYPLLESKDKETARAAAFVLGNMGGEPAARAVPYLRRALSDADPSVQGIAAACLANAGADAAGAVDALADALKRSGQPEVRRNCAIALGLILKGLRKASDPRLDRAAPIAVPALVAALEARVEIKDDGATAAGKERLREDAAEALGNVGYPHNESAFPVVREVIRKDPNQLVRQRCIWALFTCGDLERHGDLKKVLTEVLDETGDAGLMVRYDAARLLAYTLKDKAPDRTVAVLLHMLGNKDLRVFEGTGTAVEGIGDEGKRGGARVTIRSGGDARYMGAMGLGWLGEKVKKNDAVKKALAAAARDDSPELKKRAAEALEEINR